MWFRLESILDIIMNRAGTLSAYVASRWKVVFMPSQIIWVTCLVQVKSFPTALTLLAFPLDILQSLNPIHPPSPSFRGTMANLCHLAKTPSTSLRSACWQWSRPSLTTPSWSLSWKSSWQPQTVLSLCLVAGRIHLNKPVQCCPLVWLVVISHISNQSDTGRVHEAWICHFLFLPLKKWSLHPPLIKFYTNKGINCSKQLNTFPRTVSSGSWYFFGHSAREF